MVARKTRSGRLAARDAADAARMASEIPAATAVTLSHRLPAIARGILDPKQRDNADLQRMVAEKLEAGRDATAAAARGAAAAGGVLARGLRKQASAQAGLAKALQGGKGGSVLGRMAILGGASMALAFGLMNVGARTAKATLAPAHRKVTANARRLSRKAKTKA